MSIIHRTTIKPTKLELLTAWLPTRPWYQGTGAPELAKAGGFRLDDPEGEVGIEFMVATNADGTAYHVPLTYRGAPLPDAEHALVGTMEHGVLGTRWAYDAAHDPVFVAELLALVEGRAVPQMQSVDSTPDPDIARSYQGDAELRPEGAPLDDEDGTDLHTTAGWVVRIHRRLGDSDVPPSDALGHVAGHWTTADGASVRSVFAVVLTGSA
ncbi:maltokinase N-terminal cap-like domain-containing protein [Streptomyces sp. NPDC054829]|nr:1,4-alpha-glucan branching protein [Streptomyces sp. SBE_14.2]